MTYGVFELRISMVWLQFQFEVDYVTRWQLIFACLVLFLYFFLPVKFIISLSQKQCNKVLLWATKKNLLMTVKFYFYLNIYVQVCILEQIVGAVNAYLYFCILGKRSIEQRSHNHRLVCLRCDEQFFTQIQIGHLHHWEVTWPMLPLNNELESCSMPKSDRAHCNVIILHYLENSKNCLVFEIYWNK